MDTLISDGGSYEVSKIVTDILSYLLIADYQADPYHQRQNKSEKCYGTAKCWTNSAMNLSGCPASCWLLCLHYMWLLLNFTASATLGGICPIHALLGQIPDISFLLHFYFYEPVYYKVDKNEPDHGFPSPSNEKKCIGLVLLKQLEID